MRRRRRRLLKRCGNSLGHLITISEPLPLLHCRRRLLPRDVEVIYGGGGYVRSFLRPLERAPDLFSAGDSPIPSCSTWLAPPPAETAMIYVTGSAADAAEEIVFSLSLFLFPTTFVVVAARESLDGRPLVRLRRRRRHLLLLLLPGICHPNAYLSMMDGSFCLPPRSSERASERAREVAEPPVAVPRLAAIEVFPRRRPPSP
jgi:hypothetical protein